MTTSKTVEIWRAHPDTTADIRQETLWRFKYKKHYAVSSLMRGGKVESEQFEAPLYDESKYKMSLGSSAKLRSGGCIAEWCFYSSKVTIRTTKYPAPPLSDGTAIYNAIPSKMTYKELRQVFKQL